MVFEKIKFLATSIAPKPDEVSYWVDISANPYGGVIKYYNGDDWVKLDQLSIAEDYNRLRNKPTLNGVVIEGDKTSNDYNIPTPESVELVLNDFRNEINNIDEKVSNVSIRLDNYIEANEGNIEGVKQDIVNIQESLELILGESASDVIDKFNEILSFLEGYDDSQTLKGVISDLEKMINDAEDDISLLEKEIKAALDSHINDYNNPHQVTKEQVGLDQVDNTSDLNKPISTLTQQALDYEANLRDEMDTELMNRINVLQGEIDSAGKKIVTDIIDITQNNTSGVQLNYKYKDRVSLDDKYSDEKSASVLLNNASSTNNGVMSKEDKKKFDSIDSKIINDITSITYEPSNIKINYVSQNLQDGVYVKSSETKIINSATTSSAGAMSSEDKQILDAVKTTYIPLNQKGVANGVATLDENGLVPSNQLPSYVDDVIDCYATYTKADDGTLSNIVLYEDAEHQTLIVGESGKIYVDVTDATTFTNPINSEVLSQTTPQSAYQFRWTGTQFAVVGAPTVIGEVIGTAFDGARGKALEDKTNAHIANTDNPHQVTKEQVGLSNVDNTADIDKPLSTATQSAIDAVKEEINTHISNNNNPHNVTVEQIGAIPTGGLKTINGNSLEGEGDIEVSVDNEVAVTNGEEPQGNEVLWVDMNEDTSSSLEELGIQPKLESGVNIKTINGETILGEGNIELSSGGLDDAPSDGVTYGRKDGNWVKANYGTPDEVLDLSELLGSIEEDPYREVPTPVGLFQKVEDAYNKGVKYIKLNLGVLCIAPMNIIRMSELTSYYVINCLLLLPGNTESFIQYNVIAAINSKLSVITYAGNAIPILGPILSGSYAGRDGLLTEYSKSSSYSAISNNDSINKAISKLEAGIIPDAPSDGRKYVRMNGEWVKDGDLAIIEIDQTISDPATMISGDVNNGAIKWIRKNSHRVLAKKTGEGTVTYIELDDSNSNKYAADGSEAKTDGTEGDVFVKLPTFYYKGTEDDNVKLYFSLSKIDDSYVEWDTNILIGAYEAYYGDSKLQSRSGVLSSASISQPNFKLYAQARGTGYQLVDWQMHCIMGCLFYAMYGNTNSQAICGMGTYSYNKTCGETNSLGMNDTQASTNGNSQSINFWGLENWWGNKYESMQEDNIGTTMSTYDPVTKGTRTIDVPYLNDYYVKRMVFGKYMDLIPMSDDPNNGSDSIGYCDCQYWNNASTDRVVRRSCHYSDVEGGVSYANAKDSSSVVGNHLGSRLAFRGVCTKAESVEAFKSLPVL